MSEGAIVAIVIALLGAISGILTVIGSVRRDTLKSALDLVDDLRERIKDMRADIIRLEEKVDEERAMRRAAEDKVAALSSELRATREALKEQTQSRLDRENRIAELEMRLSKVEKKTGPLGEGKGESK